jgi:hypothetical protein
MLQVLAVLVVAVTALLLCLAVRSFRRYRQSVDMLSSALILIHAAYDVSHADSDI